MCETRLSVCSIRKPRNKGGCGGQEKVLRVLVWFGTTRYSVEKCIGIQDFVGSEHGS